MKVFSMMKAFFACVACLFATTLHAQYFKSEPPTPASADPSEFAEYLTESGLHGAGVGVFRDGQLECAVSGRRVANQDIWIEQDDLWHIGSLTKSMTATLAARLVEKGLLDWDSTVSAVLGESLPEISPKAREITLLQLLSHRAGIPVDTYEISTALFNMTDSPLREQRLAYAGMKLEQTLLAVPGEAFEYSNAGYVIAGAMIETATGKSWEQLIQDEVFGPLGLSSAGFGAPGTPGVIDQPWGHQPFMSMRGSTPIEPGPDADNPPLLGPAGTVHMSLCDLVRYASIHASQPEDYLSGNAWEMLHKSQGDDYALGWIVQEGKLIHNGSNTLWYAFVQIWPEHDHAVAIVTNDGRGQVLTEPFRNVIEVLAPESP